MFNKIKVLTILIASLSFTAAYGACPPPSAPPKDFPNGATASRADMMGAKKSIDAYITSARTYINCVDTAEAAELKKINADPKMDKDAKAAKMKALEQTRKQRNQIVIQMQATAKAFNAEIHKFNQQ